MPRGHLRQRSPGSWTIDLYVGIDPRTGKKRYHTETVRGPKANAQRRLNELVYQLDTGTFTRPSRETVAEFLRGWLRDYAETNVSERTLEGYRGNVDRYIVPALGLVPLARLSPRHVQTFEAELLRRGLSARTVLHAHRTLSQALRWGVRMGVLQRNFADSVQAPRPQRQETKTLDWDGVGRLLEAARGSRYYPLWLVALFTGLRRSELLALRWRDLDLASGTLAVSRRMVQLASRVMDFAPPKNGRPRVVTLPQQAVAVLQRLREVREAEGRWDADGLVFCKPDGIPYGPDTISAAFRALALKTGNDGLRFHDLRHTHASLMLVTGAHLKVVSERLGHTTVGITGDLYSHVLPGLQAEAAIRWDEKFGQLEGLDWQGIGKDGNTEI